MRQCFLLAAALLLPVTSYAGLIRDAEIENTLHAYAQPIFEAAHITPEDVRIFIIEDPRVNAYVAGGLNIFLYTGMIRQAKTPGELIGVIAHETGHIAGAHLSQFAEKSARAGLGSLLGALVGAAVLGGSMLTQGHVTSDAGQAGIGAVMGSQSMAQRMFMGDIRLNEESADHAALSFLDASDMSATGMLEMFTTLHQLEGSLASQDPFATDHPLTTERIATMRNHIKESTIPAGQVPQQFYAMHARMIAKLIAFTEPYETTLNRYPPSDTSVAARYARAIAEFKRSNLPAALAGMDALIKQAPNDPFFYDTKGQILFENGKLSEASDAYAHASTLLPRSALIQTEYAKTLIAQNNPALLAQAVALLERSKELDDSYDVTWRQLALAYGNEGKLGLSYEALAEEAALDGDYRTVIQHVARARQYAGGDASLLLQLDDLERDAKTQMKRNKDKLGE